jgi:hypothetical protein
MNRCQPLTRRTGAALTVSLSPEDVEVEPAKATRQNGETSAGSLTLARGVASLGLGHVNGLAL